jgi:hypothetical protein
MRIALVIVPAKDPEKLRVIARSMLRGFEAAGHRVETFGPEADAAHLAGFEYIVLGTEALGFGALPPRVGELLGQSYGLSGKRSFAFVRKAGFRVEKALSRLMAAMEGEGMVVTWSVVLKNAAEAAAAAKAAPVARA